MQKINKINIMCWTWQKIERPVPSIAKEDIRVIKIVDPYWETPNGGCISKNTHFPYEKEKTYETIDPLYSGVSLLNRWEIHEGFHSYSDNAEFTVFVKDYYKYIRTYPENTEYSYYDFFSLDKFVFALFVLPKGSEYYKNEVEEIVSNKIMFKNIIPVDFDTVEPNKRIKIRNFINKEDFK